MHPALKLASSSLLAVVMSCILLADEGPPQEPTTTTRKKDAEKGTATSRPDSKAKKNARSEVEIALPYPLGEWIGYRWTLDGDETGIMNLIFRDAEDHDGYSVQYNFLYDAPGRRFAQRGTVELRSDLSPLKYAHEISGLSSGMGSVDILTAEFSDEEKLALVTFKKRNGAAKERDVELTDEYYLYFQNAFFALLSPVLHTKGEGRYNMFRPNTIELYRMDFDKERKEGAYQRWSVSHDSLKATLWLTADGALHKYQQGSTEVVAIDKQQTGKKKPKSAQDKKSK